MKIGWQQDIHWNIPDILTVIRFGEAAQAEARRMGLSEDMNRTAFSLGGLNEQIKPSGERCTNVEINFGASHSSFEYDETTATYKKSMNGTPHIDGNTNQQLTFKICADP